MTGTGTSLRAAFATSASPVATAASTRACRHTHEKVTKVLMLDFTVQLNNTLYQMEGRSHPLDYKSVATELDTYSTVMHQSMHCSMR